MPPKTVTPTALKAIQQQQERIAKQVTALTEKQEQITRQINTLKYEQKGFAATVKHLVGAPASKPASKRRAASPPTAAQPSTPKKVALAAKDKSIDNNAEISLEAIFEAEIEKSKAFYNRADSPQRSDGSPSPAPSDDANKFGTAAKTIAEFLADKPDDLPYILKPDVHKCVWRCVISLLVEHTQSQLSVDKLQQLLVALYFKDDDIQEILGDLPVDFSTLDAPMKAVADAVIGGGAAGASADDGVADDDEYELVDE